MTSGMLVGLLIVLAVVAYVAAKVWYHARRSEEQWRAVDKSKLRSWEDEESD